MTFGRELVVLHTTPSMFSKLLVHAWRQYGGFNEELILYQFMEGQTDFGMPRGAMMILALNKPK